MSALASGRQKRIARTGYMLEKGEALDPAEVDRRTRCQCGEDSRPYQEEVDREFVRGQKEPVVRYETRCLTCGRSA